MLLQDGVKCHDEHESIDGYIEERLIPTTAPILFVGEWNFTHTVAIAALRKSYKNIKTSSFDITSVPDLTAVVETCRAWAKNNTEKLAPDDSDSK